MKIADLGTTFTLENLSAGRSDFMQERRKRRRFAIESRMEAILHVDGSETKGHVVDLNNIGAFIATDLVLEKDTPLDVELCVPDVEEPLRIKAVVARRADRVKGRSGDLPAGLGLMFLVDHENEERFIQNAVIVALELALEEARARTVAAPAG
jgi:hypothetical protein